MLKETLTRVKKKRRSSKIKGKQPYTVWKIGKPMGKLMGFFWKTAGGTRNKK